MSSALALFALLIAMLLALAATAFCAGAETGFLSVNRWRVIHLARAGSRRARILQRALSDLSRTLTGLLVGNNLAAVVYSSAAAAFAAEVFVEGSWFQVAWTVFSACAVLGLGEFLPKLFCATRPLRRMLRLAPAYRAFDLFFTPLTALAATMTALFAGGTSGHSRVTPDDLLGILRDRKDGVRLTDFESALIARILVLRTQGRPVTAASLLSALDEDEISDSMGTEGRQ